MVLGNGIWFEPNVYDASQKYVGPYFYKEDGKIVTTLDYSNAEYDYFKLERIHYDLCYECLSYHQ